MTGQIIFITLTVLLLLGILVLFLIKSGLQLQYLRLKNHRKPGSVWDFLKFSFSDEKARQQRVKAFLLFPMLYPIALDEQREELNKIKIRIKRIHMGIYALLIVLIVLAIYSEKVFPATA